MHFFPFRILRKRENVNVLCEEIFFQKKKHCGKILVLYIAAKIAITIQHIFLFENKFLTYPNITLSTIKLKKKKKFFSRSIFQFALVAVFLNSHCELIF